MKRPLTPPPRFLGTCRSQFFSKGGRRAVRQTTTGGLVGGAAADVGGHQWGAPLHGPSTNMRRARETSSITLHPSGRTACLRWRGETLPIPPAKLIHIKKPCNVLEQMSGGGGDGMVVT